MDVQLHPTDRMQVALPNYFYVLNFEKNFVYSESVDERSFSILFLLLCHLRSPNFWRTSLYVQQTKIRTERPTCFLEHSACAIIWFWCRKCITYYNIVFVYLNNFTFVFYSFEIGFILILSIILVLLLVL